MRNNRVNLRITVGVVFLAIVGSFSSALAYPIFFKCDSNHQMSEFLAGQEVLEGISKLKAEFNDEKKVLSALCEGKSECERNLGQILKLTDIARSVAQAKEAQILGQLKNEMNTPIAKVNDETFELEKKIRDLAAQVNACRRTEESLKPEDWKVNSCVLFYFPFKNEYSYVTGFQTSKGSATRLQCPNADGIKSTVRKSLMMGVDPLVYMSLGLMESGSNGWQHGLFLDPIGIVKGMGCPDNDDNPTVPGINKMNSYGNYHTVKPGVIEDAEFSDRLKALAKENQAQVSEGKSYVCADLHNKANLTISQASIANQCCMHLQFQLNGSSSDQTALI